MKTLLITSFHPMISRNILASPAFELLRARKDLSFIIAVQDYKVEHYRKQFGRDNVTVHGIVPYQASREWRGLLFKRLGIWLFDTGSARLRKRYDYYLNRKFFQFVFSMSVGYLGHVPFVKRFVRMLDERFSPKGIFASIFKAHHIDAVFSTDVQNENDVAMMMDARHRHIPVIAMVRSWDNLSLRILRIFPDLLLVGSDELSDEVCKLHSFPREKTRVVGNPHYDRYLLKPSKTRAEFLKSFHLPESRKLILYAPVSDALIKTNDMDAHVLTILSREDASILVRFPPEKKVTLGDFKKSANMSYDVAGQAFSPERQGDREIRPEDDQNLINALTYADVVVTGPTSICLDATLLDRPVIAVNFYPTPRHFMETVWRYRDNHIQKMLGTGGVREVRSREELTTSIREYLRDPSRDARGRVEIRRRWFSHADGRAGERLANVISGFLSHL